ncbi:hypothetical protein D3C87_1865060 [compost metagenome]
MVDGLAVPVDELPEHIADGTARGELCRRDVARQPVAHEQRALAQIAGAEDRDIGGADAREGVLEHVLRQDGVA